MTPAEMISAGSMTPLKQPEFFLLNFSYEIVKQFKNGMQNFSGVINPAEIYMTPLKF
jgi:hypothetical protein